MASVFSSVKSEVVHLTQRDLEGLCKPMSARGSPLEFYANELRPPPKKTLLTISRMALPLSVNGNSRPQSSSNISSAMPFFCAHCSCVSCPGFQKWLFPSSTVPSRYSLLDFWTAHVHTSVWFLLFPWRTRLPTCVPKPSLVMWV